MADNQKMWADLGMNLELHDMLCEVLPGAIGDVFMSQENRPAAMDYFDMVLADVHGLRPSELVEFRKNGGKVFGQDSTEHARSTDWLTSTSARTHAMERRKLTRSSARMFLCTSWTCLR